MAPMKCPSQNQPVDVFQDSLTLTHLAHRWHMHRREVRHLLQTGQLPFVQVREQLRVPRSAVAEYEQKQRPTSRRKCRVIIASSSTRHVDGSGAAAASPENVEPYGDSQIDRSASSTTNARERPPKKTAR